MYKAQDLNEWHNGLRLPKQPTAAPPRTKHGFRAVQNNGVSYELTCKCGQLWAGRNKTTLLACFDAHITLYEDGD